MVSLSSFAKLGAAARNAVTSREAQTTLKNLETIEAAVKKLATTMTNYQGGLLSASNISGDVAALGIDIKNATGDVKKSEVVTEAEADEIIQYTLTTLEPSVAQSMTATKEKKAKLADAGLQGTVLGDLQDLRAQTDALNKALVEKAPATKQAEAKAAAEKIDALFEDAISNFK